MQGSVTYQYLQDNDMAIIRKSGFQQMLAQMDVVEKENDKLRAALHEISKWNNLRDRYSDCIDFVICAALKVEKKDD